MIKKIKNWWLRQTIKRKPKNWKRVTKRKYLIDSRECLNLDPQYPCLPNDDLLGPLTISMMDNEVRYIANSSAVEIVIPWSHRLFYLTLWRNMRTIELKECLRKRDYHLHLYSLEGTPLYRIANRLKRIAFIERDLT